MHALDVWIEAHGTVHRRRLVFASSDEFRARFVYPADLFVALQSHADALHLDDEDGNHPGDGDDSEDGGSWDMDARELYVLSTCEGRMRRYARRGGAWEMERADDEVDDQVVPLNVWVRLDTPYTDADMGAGQGLGLVSTAPELLADDDVLCEQLLGAHIPASPGDMILRNNQYCRRLDTLTRGEFAQMLRTMEQREWNDVVFVRDVSERKTRRLIREDKGRCDVARARERERGESGTASWVSWILEQQTWNVMLGISNMSLTSRGRPNS